MPKMKTHSGTKKRMWITGSGRVRRGTAGLSHMMRGKSANRLRRLRKHSMVSSTHEKMQKRLLPSGRV
jgi:large subunit ribosomal protein L35